MLANTETVGLSLFSSEEGSMGPRRGRGMGSCPADRCAGAGRAARRIVGGPADAGIGGSNGAGGPLVVRVSDLLTPGGVVAGRGLARLGHDRHEVIVNPRVLDADEITFPFRRWTVFRGLENERSRECDPVLARQTYLDNFQAHANELDAMIRGSAR